jgi:hypothetical protein
MAWTVAFALLGALLFSMLVAPVLATFLFRTGAREWKNPVMEFLVVRYRSGVTWAIHHRAVTVGTGVACLALAIYLFFGGVIGSEFLPHLDEGSLWVRGTLAQSAGLVKGSAWPIRPGSCSVLFPKRPNAPVRQAARSERIAWLHIVHCKAAGSPYASVGRVDEPADRPALAMLRRVGQGGSARAIQ